MTDLSEHKKEYADKGFTVINSVFTQEEVDKLIYIIEQGDSTNLTFRRSKDLFAIRQFLKEIPEAIALIFNQHIRNIVRQLFGDDYVPVKSIYFDKPADSNWFVSYHQDLTISVEQKFDVAGFGPWTTKQNQFAVQPPLEILENNFTVRIHLDDTDENNGALRVIPQSHAKGIYRPETINWAKESEVSCRVKMGGIMIMSPLLLHASSKTTNNRKRRVIHIEFSNQTLAEPLRWSERVEITG
jgi:ectoine hydroxylase-related dioxygenase (phytanoyl-CoA dioxygenase family)